MDEHLKWRYEQLDGRVALVADNLPGYRAQIIAVLPQRGLKCRAWAVYENQQVIACGTTAHTALAKRRCALYLRLARQYPQFDKLPPLDRTIVS